MVQQLAAFYNTDSDDDVYADHIDVVFEEDGLHSSGYEHVNFTNNQESSGICRRRKNLSDQERHEIYQALLAISNNGKLKKDSTTIVANRFIVKRTYVQAIWRVAKKCIAAGIAVDINCKRKKNSGRKKLQINLSQVSTIDLNERTTIRALAGSLHVNKTSLHRAFKEGRLRRYSNTLKPYLQDSNKKHRLQFCVSMLQTNSVGSGPTFIDMHNIVHIDEKWFNMTKKAKKFYMLPEEEDPHRSVQNKNSIPKVVMLGAAAQPRFDSENRCYFDGKLGIWPFVRKVNLYFNVLRFIYHILLAYKYCDLTIAYFVGAGQRRSRNRPRGALVTKSINVTRDISRAFLITKVIAAIVASWPVEDRGKTIWIQQDNARTHVLPDDEVVLLAVQQYGLDIRLMNQPPNSLDMNVLDLGFFSALQAKTYLKSSKNIDELMQNVEVEYNSYDPALLNRVFLTLQGCLIEVMKIRGGNRYKIPHMNKECLERLGMLPRSLTCVLDLYHQVMEVLAVI